ncbi:MAG TPA: helix-turn-helix transcriptional regulator, partial [Solirubrobacteraceae bacterium]
MDTHRIDTPTSHSAQPTPLRGRRVSHVRRIRLLSGLALTEVAAAAGISRQTLTAIELERSVPQLGTAQALADVLT